jgi:Subtilase family
VISMSLGYGRPSLAVRQALQTAFDHGVVVVASSGNSGAAAAAHGRSAPYSFPADYPGVLGVAAVKMDGSPAGFSSDNLSVQIAAPGVKVPAQGTDGKYWLVSGTSPACALTAGVAALIKSKYPALSPSLVRQAITTTATNAPAGNYNAQVGFGTVDAPAALAAAGHFAIQARQLHRRPPKRSAQPDGYFGGGPREAPHAPIRPRGPGSLVLFCLLGLACLVAVVFATSRLATIRRQPAAAGGARAAPGAPAGEWPATGYDGASGLPTGEGPARGYDGASGYDRAPGYDRASAYGQGAGDDQAPGYDRGAGYDGASGYDRGAGYDGASGYDRGTGYDGASGYDRGTGYDQASGYDPGTGYEGASGYDPGTGYEGASGYDRGTGHDGASGYDQGTGEDRATGHDGSSGYDRSSAQGPATAAELADQHSASDQAPDDAQHEPRRPSLWLPPGHEGRHAAAPHRPSVAWPPE